MAPVITHPRVFDLTSGVVPTTSYDSRVGEILVSETVLVPDLGEQSYFWAPLWQQWEMEATENLKSGRYADFGSISELIDDLERGSTD